MAKGETYPVSRLGGQADRRLLHHARGKRRNVPRESVDFLGRTEADVDGMRFQAETRTAAIPDNGLRLAV